MLKINQKLLFIVSVSVLALAACEEDINETIPGEQGDTLKVSSDIPAPIVREVASTVPTTLKFGFSVKSEQAKDTVYYLLLPDSVASPSVTELRSHTGVTELPMEGNSFRSAFRTNLSAETKYVIYAVLRKGQYSSEVASLSLTTGKSDDTTSSDEDDDNQETPPMTDPPPTDTTTTPPPKPTAAQDTTTAPVLEPRGLPQNDVISLAVSVESDQIDGTLHYLYFTESKNPGMPTPQELVDHRLTETVPMGGATLKKFNFPATSKTKYYIYAVLQVGEKLSRVVLLERETT